MQKKEIFIGVDVSKLTLDVSTHGTKSHIRVNNSSEGFKQLLAWLKTLNIVPEIAGLYWNIPVDTSTGSFSFASPNKLVLPVFRVWRSKSLLVCREVKMIRLTLNA